MGDHPHYVVHHTITSIAQQLKDMQASAVDAAQLQAGVTQVISDLEAGRTALAAAVLANTPAAPQA